MPRVTRDDLRNNRIFASAFRGVGVLFLMLAAAFIPASGQAKNKKATQRNAPPKTTAPKTTDKLSQTRADVVTATNDLKSKIETLIELYTADLKDAQQALETRKGLLAEGLISKRELDEGERRVTEIQAKIASAQRDIKEADELVAEVYAAEQLAKSPPRSNVVTSAFTRFAGGSRWSISDAAKVQSFFSTRFGHALPVSAFGQSAFHARVGLDHRNAIDVAVHPDTAEGQALMDFLRASGIPFIAFRQAVPGSATGAHIHIGNPSHRIAPSP